MATLERVASVERDHCTVINLPLPICDKSIWIIETWFTIVWQTFGMVSFKQGPYIDTGSLV